MQPLISEEQRRTNAQMGVSDEVYLRAFPNGAPAAVSGKGPLTATQRTERAKAQRAADAQMGVSDATFLKHNPDWTLQELYCDLPPSQIPAQPRTEPHRADQIP